MNFVRSNNLSLKYQKFTPSGCKNIRILKLGFVAKTQFLSQKLTKFRGFTFAKTLRNSYNENFVGILSCPL